MPRPEYNPEEAMKRFLADPYCQGCGLKITKPRQDGAWYCSGCTAQAAWEDARSR